MHRSLIAATAGLLAVANSLCAGEPPPPEQRVQVVVIPVHEEVGRPLHYIIRRGLKEAIDRQADAVVLDMDTPGGALDVTFDIMEAIGKFPGTTITFVDDEALSAGAFISATTDEIWFSPVGVIGAAAPVLATGGDIDATMRQKLVSYLRARVRAISEGKGYRGEVISAMIDSDYELKIGERVLKPKGELLSLTAKEASEEFGDPPQPLLAAGTASSIDALLTAKFGEGRYTVLALEVSWSERLAVLLNALSPILLGAGLLCLYIEFKTPGFGVFGVTGGVLLGIVFFGNYVAGLSGHEPALVFVIGMLLIFIELFFFPGVFAVALAGLLLMVGSLLWSMADIWPNEPLTLSGEVFVNPLLNLSAGILIAVVLAVLLVRYLPKGWFWDRMVLSAEVAANAGSFSAGALAELIGQIGVAVTALRPGGQVEIGGRRYEASLPVGHAEPGDEVVVTECRGFSLGVERRQS